METVTMKQSLELWSSDVDSETSVSSNKDIKYVCEFRTLAVKDAHHVSSVKSACYLLFCDGGL